VSAFSRTEQDERERQLRQREKDMAAREREIVEQQRVLAEQHRILQTAARQAPATPAAPTALSAATPAPRQAAPAAWPPRRDAAGPRPHRYSAYRRPQRTFWQRVRDTLFGIEPALEDSL
jgi:hypothetical protein